MFNNKREKVFFVYAPIIIILFGVFMFLFQDIKYSDIEVNNIKKLNQLSDIELVEDNYDFAHFYAKSNNKNVKFTIDKDNKELYKKAYIDSTSHQDIFNSSNLLLGAFLLIIICLIIGIIMKQQKSELREEKELSNVKPNKSKGGTFELSYSDTNFTDVAGYDYAKEELFEIIDQLKEPDKYHKLGAKMIKGGILYGPPGTGKTFLAKALAGEADVPFISLSGTDFVEEVVGRGANRIRELFEFAKANSPCIIFIDEMDAVGSKRSGDVNTKEWDNTVNAMLVELDGFKTDNHHVVVLGATNKVDTLDEALLRPGRMDRKIEIGKPDYDTRLHILNHLTTTQNRNFNKDCDLENLAHLTYNFAAAELEQIINESILLSARKKKDQVSNTELLEAYDKVTLGISSDKKLSDLDKKTVAYHEAGHAVITKLLKPDEIIQKVTILPQGKSLGFVSKMPKQDMVLHSKEYLENEINILLAGRVSEDIFFNRITTGAQNDFERATMLVSHMDNQFGMYDHLAVINDRIDYDLVNQKLRNYYDNLKSKIVENKDLKYQIEIVAKFLLKKECITGNELDIILKQLKEKARIK